MQIIGVRRQTSECRRGIEGPAVTYIVEVRYIGSDWADLMADMRSWLDRRQIDTEEFDYSSGALAFAWYGAANLLGYQTGEFSFDWFWIGHIFATVIYGAIIVQMMRRFKLVGLAKPHTYWTMIALIRTAGTAAGDYLSKTQLQLSGSTIVTGLCFATLIFVFYILQKDNQSTAIDIRQPA